jgi:hypothetical protein
MYQSKSFIPFCAFQLVADLGKVVYQGVDYGLSLDEERNVETGFSNLIIRMIYSGECQLPNENLFFQSLFNVIIELRRVP